MAPGTFIFGFFLLSACAGFTVGVASETEEEATVSKAASGPLTWSCPVCGKVNHDNRRKCTTRDCRHPGGRPSAWDNRRCTRHGSRTRTSASSASRRWTCPDCSHQNYAWRGYCHSCSRAVSSGGRGTGGGGSPARKPAHRATFGDVLSAECERLRGGESLSSEAMAVEDAGPAKAEEQDRLKALDASIANLERARGGKPDVAIDEVLRQKRLERQDLKDQMQSRKSTKALLKAAMAAREKAVIKLEGLQKEEMDLTQLLLLKQQEIPDAKSEASEKAREVETLQARRLAEVDCEGSVSHVSSSASCSAPPSPQQWALGLAASLPEDVRVKLEEWYSSVEIEANASVDPYSEVLSQGSPATLLPADPVSSTPVAATSTGSAFRAAKAPFPSQRATPYAARFQVSKSQERPISSECRRPAVAADV